MASDMLGNERPSILVIDDEPKICMLIKRFLQQTDLFHSIVTAENISTAIFKMQNEHFDLVIVDYNLPDKKGTTFVENIHKSIKYRKVKVLLISGYLDKKSMVDVINAGINQVLVKPFARKSLIKKVCNILNIEPPA